MVNWRTQLVPAVAATSLLLGSGAVASPISEAQQAVLIPGATVFKRINPIYPIVAQSYPSIGINFHDNDAVLHLIDYSQNALASNSALRDGVAQAVPVVQALDGKVVIIGESMGSMVAWRVAAALADSPSPPSTDDVSVVLIAPPEVGVAEWFKEGTYIPVLNYRITRIAESPYDTTIVVGEYDGWADPPDRPWNLASSANALAGIVYVHGPPIFTTDPHAPGVITTTIDANEDHGKITNVFVPTEHLPLTQVFRDVGVPDALVDKADDVLRPVIDAGYVRHDQPGDTRPYLFDGGIHRNVQSQQQAREPQQASLETSSADRQQRRERRNEIRDAVRDKVRDAVEHGLGELKKTVEKLAPSRS
jgi:diacyltrehalose acyltransferase